MSFYSYNWFKNLTGVDECTFRAFSKKYFKFDDNKTILIGKNEEYDCGNINVVRLGDLRNLYKNLNLCENSEKLKLKIYYSRSFDFEKYNITNLQEKFPNGVFLVASNFNALEGINESKSPESPNFLTSYYADHTQGPTASIGCPAATIYRYIHSLNNPLNMLKNFEFYNIHNGYPVLNKTAIEIKEINSDDYISIYQTNAEVNYVHKNPDELSLIRGPKITQVFAAAVNRKQGSTGMLNNEICSQNPLLASIPLECGYETAYLVSILEKSHHLELCLLGNGVFGNSLENIYNAILKVHEKYQNKSGSLENVEIRLFGPQQMQNIIKMKSLITNLNKNVDVEFIEV